MEITLSDFFEFNPFDNKIGSKFLKYLPETTKSKNGEVVDVKDEFWRWFYYDNTELLKGTTEALIENIRKSNVHFIIFKGPSGSGKTTYIHNIIREREQYFKTFEVLPFFDVVNLIEYPFTSDTDSSLFLNALHNKIIKIIDSELVAALHSAILECENKQPIMIRGVKLLMDSYTDFTDVLSDCNGMCSDYEIPEKVISFLLSVKSVSDTIALYSIFYIFKNCLIENKKGHFIPSVFVFDNLDELEVGYLTRNLVNDLYDAFSKAQGFFEMLEGSNTVAGNYEFVSYCTFVESVREGFVSEYNKCQFSNQSGTRLSTQRNERLKKRSSSIHFNVNFKDSTYNIAKKRFGLFRHYMEVAKKELPGMWFENGKLLVDEKSYIEDISNLFNNDYRMTLSCLSEALIKDIKSWETLSKNDNDCILGIRGFLLFHILKTLYREDTAFSDYVSAELNDDSCNKNRMFMSLLANNDGEIIRRNGGSFTQKAKKLSLREFTERVVSWYTNTDVYDVYKTVFESNNNNYSILASLEGYIIDDYLLKKKIVTINNLCDELAKLYITNPDKLNPVKIMVNPVCRAYTQDVFINFEYFNLVSIAVLDNDEDLLCAQSLFQYDSYEAVESCLSRVYKVTKEIVRKADRYVCNKCKDCKYHPENKAIGCFSQIKKLNDDGFLIKNSLYKTRVINSHINYLDSFRKMMWHKYHEQDQETYEKFHKLILCYVSYYINNLFYYEKGVIDTSEVFIKILERYEKAKSIGCREWVPISIGY